MTLLLFILMVCAFTYWRSPMQPQKMCEACHRPLTRHADTCPIEIWNNLNGDR
jgi:hypothetical protein